jgi:hypothetical protein
MSNKIIKKGCDFIRTFFNLKLKTKPMEQKRKYPIRQVSITNMTNFLNLLSGKTYRSNEIVELSKQYHIRANFLGYAKKMNYCKKDESGAYYFLNRVFDPIHAKHLIEMSNKYNNEVMAKKKRLLEQKESLTTNVELDESVKIEETHFHQRNLLELQLTQIKSENDILENEVSDLLDANANLKKSVNYLNEEIKGLNDIIWNNNNYDSLQKENDLLKEKISSLEKLVSIYFK